MSKKDLTKPQDIDNKTVPDTAQDSSENVEAAPEEVPENPEVDAEEVPKNSEEDMVNIFLFKDKDKYNSDLPVSINGKTWLVQRGVNVKVPRFVAEVINNSMEQDAKGSELIKIQEDKFS